MRISHIHIENFRSIEKVDFQPMAFNVLVGQNNHGKTNVFKALEWFYGGKGELNEIRSTFSPNGEIVVELTFSGVQDGIKQISNAENQTKLRAIVETSDIMRVRRTTGDPKARYVFHPKTNEWKKQPTGTDPAFNNCIPRFEFIEATKHLKDVSGYSSKTPIGQILGGVLTGILEGDEEYKKFKASFEAVFQSEKSGIRKKLAALADDVKCHLQQQFPDCSDVQFEVGEPSIEDLFENFTTRLNDGVPTAAEDKGDGMQRALMLAIIKAHADHRRNDALGKAFIFFIDEAELHLHPGAQRHLKKALFDLSQASDQVFINTHSSVLMVDEHEKQSVFRVKKCSGKTEVIPVAGQSKQDVIFQLLGGSPADLLLPANFLIVEGPSDKLFLENLISRFYRDKPSIQVVAAYGNDERAHQSMDAINLVFKPLDTPIYRDKLTILIDEPYGDTEKRRLNNFRSEHPRLDKNKQIYVLPVKALEEYYPDRWKNLGLGKLVWAERVAKEITKDEFEKKMSVVYNAINQCWDRAYINNQVNPIPSSSAPPCS